MRAFSVIIIFIFWAYSSAFAGADYAREKKWADEIVPGIVVGDTVYLKPGQGHQFLTIWNEVDNAKMGLIVIHGVGVHPDWNY